MPFIKRNLLSLGAMFLIAGSPISLESRARQIPSAPSAAPSRTLLDFDDGWLFSRGDFASAAMPAFRDSAWRPVTLPHDWSSEGPFSAESGSGNGYAPGGIGWYRKHFRLDPGI